MLTVAKKRQVVIFRYGMESTGVFQPSAVLLLIEGRFLLGLDEFNNRNLKRAGSSYDFAGK
jgi:hypothetical protein